MKARQFVAVFKMISYVFLLKAVLYLFLRINIMRHLRYLTEFFRFPGDVFAVGPKPVAYYWFNDGSGQNLKESVSNTPDAGQVVFFAVLKRSQTT